MEFQAWLQQFGFSKHPFAQAQADAEADFGKYFVDHPAYTLLRDQTNPRSVLLHAPRGHGKTAARRNLESELTKTKGMLVLTLIEWDWALADLEAGRQPPLTSYVAQIARLLVLAVAKQLETGGSWLKIADDPDLRASWAWLSKHYGQLLKPKSRRALLTAGLLSGEDVSEYTFEHLPIGQQLAYFAELVEGLGGVQIHLLIDRIDELLITSSSPNAGADLIEPLIGNLVFHETSHLLVRYFIPSEVYAVLEARGSLRKDRLQIEALTWEGTESQPQLLELLHQRIASYNTIGRSTLHELLQDRIRDDDVDTALIQAANGSPRRMINLGDRIFRRCASEATDDQILITWAQIEAVCASADLAAPFAAAVSETVRPAALEFTATQPAQATSGVAPLRIQGGVIYRGDEEIAGWQKLPPMQRQLLEYLYARRGEHCTRKAIEAHIWGTPPADEASLRHLVTRLRRFLEPDPEAPIYLEAIIGGGLRMNHAE